MTKFDLFENNCENTLPHQELALFLEGHCTLKKSYRDNG